MHIRDIVQSDALDLLFSGKQKPPVVVIIASPVNTKFNPINICTADLLVAGNTIDYI